MRGWWARCALGVGLSVAVGCGEAATSEDGGGPVDAGSGATDAGAVRDAGTRDAGSRDAGGPMDAGGGLDAGAGADAGTDAGWDGTRDPNHIQVAIFPIRFADMASFPTTAELEDRFDTDLVRRFYRDASYGAATYSAYVAPTVSHPRNAHEVYDTDTFSVDWSRLVGELDLRDATVSEDTHYIVLFVPVDRYFPPGFDDPCPSDRVCFVPGSVTNGIGLPADRTLTLNGAALSEYVFLSVDGNNLDRARSYRIDYYDFATGTATGEEGQVTGETLPIGFTVATFLHEMGHHLGISNHANSWTNGERFHFEAPVSGASGQQNYGDFFSVMGSASSVVPVFSGPYRWALGWGREQTLSLEPDTSRDVTLHPIHVVGQTTLAKFRLEGNDFDEAAFYLEVRGDDDWHSFVASNDRLSVNLEGIQIRFRESGFNPSSLLLDPTPTPPGEFSRAVDDVTLRPGMEVHYPQLSLTDVRPGRGGAYTVHVETFSTPRTIPGRPIDLSTRNVGDDLAVDWTRGDDGTATGYRVQLLDAAGAVVGVVTTGSVAATATVPAAMLAGARALRVRAEAGAVPGNWSRRVSLP